MERQLVIDQEFLNTDIFNNPNLLRVWLWTSLQDNSISQKRAAEILGMPLTTFRRCKSSLNGWPQGVATCAPPATLEASENTEKQRVKSESQGWPLARQKGWPREECNTKKTIVDNSPVSTPQYPEFLSHVDTQVSEQDFIQLWNQTPGVTKIREKDGTLMLNATRRSLLAARLSNPSWWPDLKTALARFPLAGYFDGTKTPCPNWILKDDTVDRILEGEFDGVAKQKTFLDDDFSF